MIYPSLRAVEVTPIQHEGQQVIVVRDPEGLCQQSLAVPPLVFLVMSLLDGQHDVRAMQEALTRAAGGQLVTAEQIEQIVAELDEFYLLENERTAARRLELDRDYESLVVRPATHAGASYPEDEEACAEMFAGFFDGLDGAATDGKGPRGLIVPHIDLRIGGRLLAQGLATLDRAKPPRLVVILGVAHAPAKNLFTLTDKSFATPLGPVQTDREAVSFLRERYGAARLDHARVHLNEHSIEFTAVALKYLYRGGPEIRILPILCGGLVEEMMPDGPSPAARAEVGEFIEALRALIEHYEDDVCVVASVDLSHVGLKFGDAEGVDEIRALQVRQADAAMLEHVSQMQPEQFFDHFRADGNARHVDAVTAVYVMMHALGKGRVEQIAYDQWREEATDSMVTYASAAIY